MKSFNPFPTQAPEVPGLSLDKPRSSAFALLQPRTFYLAFGVVGLVTAGCAQTLAASGASPVRASSPETSAIAVSLSDLDVETPRGRREARVRLAKAAQRMCRKWGDERRVDDWATYSDCTQETLAKALKQLASTRLDARN
jgi:UrcA family protein